MTEVTEGQRIAAYLFAGFSIFLTLRLALHGSSFCLIRFQIPEHLFSLYVNRIHNAMQLLTLFGSAFGTLWTNVLQAGSGTNPDDKEYVSIVVNWSFFLINVIILIAFVVGGKNGCITFFYWSMAISSFIFSTNMQFIFSMAGPNVVWYLASENSTQILTSMLHWILLFFYGNRRKHYTEYVVIVWQIVISAMVTLVSAILWTAVYALEGSGSETVRQKAVNALNEAATAVGELINAVSKESNGQCAGLQGPADELKQDAEALNGKCNVDNLGGLKDKINVVTGALSIVATDKNRCAGHLGTIKTALDTAVKALGKPACNSIESEVVKLNELITACNNLASKARQLVDAKSEAKKALEGARDVIQKLLDHGITKKNQLNTDASDTAFTTAVDGVQQNAGALKNQCGALSGLQSKASALYGRLNSGRDDLKDDLEALKGALDSAANAIQGDGCSGLNSAETTLNNLTEKLNELTKAAGDDYDSYLKDRLKYSPSPMLMCTIGLGMVFAFYPAIAPGMLVEFRLVHRVDMILLLVSPIPSVTIALLSKISQATAEAAGRDWFKPYNPALNPWKGVAGFWHGFHIFTVIEITCAILFIIALQYPHLPMSKGMRRPFWACVVSIMFYMSQEILAALGYGGVGGNAGKGHYLNEVNNFLVRLSMIIFISCIGGFNS